MAKIFINFKRLFLASKVLSEAIKIQSIIEKKFLTFPKGAKRICILLLRQNIDLANCALVLCREKQLSGAKILTRSLLETSAYLLFISEKDQEERVELYRHSLALSRKVAVDEFNATVPEDCEKVDMEFYNRAEKDAFKYFHDKHGSDKEEKDIKRKYTLDPKKAASRLSGDAKKIYDTLYTKFYRPVSALSHGQDPIDSYKFIDQTIETKKKVKESVDVGLRVVIQTVCILILYDLIYIDQFLELNCKNQIEAINREVSRIIDLIKESS